MKTLNNFFFGEETISKHDFLWFYGLAGLMVSLGAISIIVGTVL